VEFYRCAHFDEPVLKQCAGWAAAANREKLTAACPGYQGRTCRECPVPTAGIVLSDSSLGDVALNCWFPGAAQNVPAGMVDAVRLFGGKLADRKGTNLRESWPEELRSGEPRLEFRAKAYGITETRRPTATLDPAAVAWARKLRTPGRTLAVFAPHSKQREREWVAGHWQALGEALAAQGVEILMDLGRPDSELQGGPWRCFIRQPIPRMAAMITEADLTVTVDSGPAHVAGTLDRPTLLLIGLYRDNSYEHLPSVQPIRSGLPCSPCNMQALYGSQCHNGCEAMQALTPGDVAERALRMLHPTDIGVCSLATDKIADVRAVTRPNLTAYCERQGYPLHYETIAGTSRPASWGKILMLRRELGDHDWLWWADADLIVTAPERRLQELTDGATGDLLIAADHNGINCGSFLLRNCPWSHDFLRRVWATTEDVRHMWWEQWAIMRLLADSPDDRSHVQTVRKRRLNAYPGDWRPGDFCLHTPGAADRLKILRNHVASSVESR
jgi:hypothetical protein